MSLLQIAEPGQTAKPHQSKLVIGIDLGTTNSLVAATRHGVADVLPDNEGRAIVPSVLAISPSGEKLIGNQAIDNSDNEVLKISSVKRILGYSMSELKEQGIDIQYDLVDVNGISSIKTPVGVINPIEVSVEILSLLKQRAEDSFGQSVDGAVITVPAYFDESRRKATKDAAAMAGLNVLRLINEPTAAALAYGLDNAAKGNVIVYDLGGGTFDVSVLVLSDGVFEVKATAGDILLGGDDFDEKIMGWMADNIDNISGQIDDAIPTDKLRKLAKKAKEQLATVEQTPITIGNQTLTLDRQTFEELITPLVERTIDCTKQALKDAKLTPAEIEHVVMVGGSTRTLSVQTALKKHFDLHILNDVDPDKVVAIGAAIAAENLSGNKANDSLLLDVTPLSLGVETAGELVEVIIPRNTPIPISKAQDFTTYKNGQTAMSIHVIQGERDNVNECRSLAKFSLKGIPPMMAGTARIRITFAIDADGLLTVSAKEQTTGVHSEIDVTPSYGLSDEQVAEMLISSMNSAESDIDFRRLKEQQVEAERVLDAIRQAIAEDGHLIDESEAEKIVPAIQHLEHSILGSDASVIKQAITDLEKAADSFIEKRMNAAVMKVMQGQNVTDFEDSN